MVFAHFLCVFRLNLCLIVCKFMSSNFLFELFKINICIFVEKNFYDMFAFNYDIAKIFVNLFLANLV